MLYQNLDARRYTCVYLQINASTMLSCLVACTFVAE